MHEWADTGLIISLKKFGEQDGIVTFLTQSHGKHAGLCKRAFSKRLVGTFQIGNLMQLRWKARLEEHLGNVTAELLTSYSVKVLNNPEALLTLSTLCAMCSLLPEREALEEFFQKTLEQMLLIEHQGFFERYARWELELLKVLGFGLDLSCCAVTGQEDDLIYVSPKSGRAVSRFAGENWKNKLLELPDFLLSEEISPINCQEIKKALTLTGFFLEHYAIKTLNCSIPAVRNQLLKKIAEYKD